MKLPAEKLILGTLILTLGYFLHSHLSNPYVLIYRLSQYAVMIAGFLFMAFRWTGDPVQKWSIKKRWSLMALLWVCSSFLVSLTFIIYSQVPKNEPILLRHFFLPWVIDKFLKDLVLGLITGWIYGLFRYTFLTKNFRRLKINCAILGITILIGGGIMLYDITYQGTETIRFLDKDQKLTSLQEVLSQSEIKGKQVYIDLWFSSCKPCINAFKNMKPGKSFLEEEGFVILYLGRETSHPNAKQRWINVIKEFGLEGYHVYMSKELEKDITEKTVSQLDRILGFPHYMFVNSEGKVTDWDAPDIVDLASLKRSLNEQPDPSFYISTEHVK